MNSTNIAFTVNNSQERRPQWDQRFHVSSLSNKTKAHPYYRVITLFSLHIELL